MVAVLVNVVLVFGLLMLAGVFVQQLAQSAKGWTAFRFWWAPGLVLHELSHAGATVLTGGRVVEFHLDFRGGSGHVTSIHRLPVAGQILVSYAPLVGGVLGVLLLNRLLGSPVAEPAALTAAEASRFSAVGSILSNAWQAVVDNVTVHAWQSWRFWVVVVFATSLAVAALPSATDIRVAGKSLLIVAAVGVPLLLVLEVVLGREGTSWLRGGVAALIAFSPLYVMYFTMGAVLFFALGAALSLLRDGLSGRRR